ncbi:hypothetical protein FDP22_19190 (plasmid) [Paroceanicella profunda]|uniref:Uncharacterized protein n=2 Tax=Paroceanicella profunda TaxID=2579971 RepID=A0A5B8G2X2_9RHOB|nr:hypothetical protein [Paroceanicella profunda]QDL94280.1 hypothetical protein FDP22_19190 [Paroceanicella profunda]
MPAFHMPLSGNVSQIFSQWSAFISAIGNSFSLVTINMGRSANPKVEQAVLEDVGSYGRQLGRIGDALAVLVAHFDPKTPLTPAEQDALDAFRCMLREIEKVKARTLPPA